MHIYFAKIGLVMVPLSSAFQVYIGMIHFRPLMDTVAVAGEGQWWAFKISCLAVVYFEYHMPCHSSKMPSA